MRNPLVTLATLLSLLGACAPEVPARAEGSSTTAAPIPPARENPVPRYSVGSIKGDTFLLVAVGSQSMRVPVSDSTPCGFQPYLRLVISDEHNFYQVSDNRPTCFGPATDSASHWTGLWSTYRVSGDTLSLFQGDGDETYQWVTGILTADSLIQIYGDKPYRFARIRPAGATKAP